jgi:hypothetical protein
VNARHAIVKCEIAGLFPADDARGCDNCSIYYWTIGHVFPIPQKSARATVILKQCLLARFRLWIDADQHKRLSAYINPNLIKDRGTLFLQIA